MAVQKKKTSTLDLKDYELIIAEKPSAAKKIAEALSTSKIIINNIQGVKDYIIDHNGKDIIIANAVGHLYSLMQINGTKNEYPVFNIEWAPSSDVNKSSSFTKKYLSRLKKLAKNAKTFTIATDYDVEGEVIGWNIIRFACKQKDANRMKFSTTTKNDLLKSYNNKLNTLDWGQAYAGETRHKLDWFYGINISRALTQAISNSGRFKVLSTGRVQGPLLKILVDKEKEIQAFNPVPFWVLSAELLKDNKELLAVHVKDKFFDKNEFEKIKEKVSNQDKAKVSSIEKSEFKQDPPKPFDLTAMQIEAFKCFRISPKETLSIAQHLYTESYISYPRTSSNQLPKEIGYENILNDLSRQSDYKELVSKLLSQQKTLTPNNGKKKDPAHPAIYPTGEIPKSLDDRQKKIYDLIVKRFISTFASPATRETMKIIFDINSEEFLLKGTLTKIKAWHEFYYPYIKLKEQELPVFAKDEVVPIKQIIGEEKETQPPKRYTDASIIRELEKRNLGTKATRASILDTLQQRGYIEGKPIAVTEVGMKIESILEKFCSEILDEELTRNFELEMEEIRDKKKTEQEVLDEAKEVLKKTITKFDTKKENVGKALIEADNTQKEVENFYGPCPKCKEGKLTAKYGKYGQFLACDKYPDCDYTLALPKNALNRYAGRQCEFCNNPIVKVIRKGKRPEEICINPNCPSKKEQEKELQEFVGQECPKCNEGKLMIRQSAYGPFVACSRFPKCRYVKRIYKKKTE